MADDLAAVRARLEPKRRTVGYVVIDHEDFRALMDGLDAQAARLAAAEAQRDQARACYEDSRTTSARLLLEQEQYAQTVRNLTERAEFARQRATRLAALEAAARAWVQSDRGTWEAAEAGSHLSAAVRTLDAAPADTAPA